MPMPAAIQSTEATPADGASQQDDAMHAINYALLIATSQFNAHPPGGD